MFSQIVFNEGKTIISPGKCKQHTWSIYKYTFIQDIKTLMCSKCEVPLKKKTVCDDCNDFIILLTGHWGNLHWQEVPLYRKCKHPRSYSDGYCCEPENEAHNCHQAWLSASHQKVQPIWETSQESFSPFITLLQVCFTCFYKNYD